MPRLSDEAVNQYALLDKVQRLPRTVVITSSCLGGTEFCFSQQLEEDFQVFTRKNVAPFVKAVRDVGGPSHAEHMEHRLEFTDAYHAFLDHFESKIQSHIATIGGDNDEFQRQCARALADLPPRSERRFFLEALLATTEYERFFVLMVNEACRVEMENGSHK